jgi:hypothetical protein
MTLKENGGRVAGRRNAGVRPNRPLGLERGRLIQQVIMIVIFFTHYYRDRKQ